MLESCKNSRQKYQAHLDAKDQEKQEESKKKEKEKEAETQEKALLGSGSKVDIIQSKIKMADAMIEDGNKSLKACLVKMVVSLFKEGQEKVEVVVKRKSELNAELEKLTKKKND